ncbi:hypothetical protein UPYG_G00202580 [Umbra pygmaea]|uniref:Metallothionein n=1 Tax=Umbra pygmaea TaxID=75934 RepID=A0ABD0X4Q5_UMBPY
MDATFTSGFPGHYNTFTDQSASDSSAANPTSADPASADQSATDLLATGPATSVPSTTDTTFSNTSSTGAVPCSGGSTPTACSCSCVHCTCSSCPTFLPSPAPVNGVMITLLMVSFPQLDLLLRRFSYLSYLDILLNPRGACTEKDTDHSGVHVPRLDTSFLQKTVIFT